MKIRINKKGVDINTKKVSGLGKFAGLMFKSRNAPNLLFLNTNTIHSYFVFFPFLAVWLDEKNNVVDLSVVKPFTLSASPSKPAKKLVEIPFNDENKPLIRLLVGKRRLGSYPLPPP